MSRANQQRRRRLAEGPSPAELLEEAIHLVRRAPTAALAVYAAGAVPWVLVFLHFWARMSWFAPSGPDRAWAALLLAGVFVWLKVAQADFCARLLAVRSGGTPEPLTFARVRMLAAAQLRIQVWGLIVLPLAAVATVPFGWLYAFYQNATVLGATPDEPARLRTESWKLALLWTKQNHALLLYASAFGLVVWVNVLSSAYLLPWLARTLLGVENFLALKGFAFFNTTFLAIVTALAWLAMDPLVKAMYVLRVFHGRAQKTGDDLREVFVTRRTPGARTRTAAVLSLALLLGAVVCDRMPAARAADAVVETPTAGVAPVPGTKVPPAELDRAIDETLAGRDFQWSLRPRPHDSVEEDESAVGRFFRQSVEWTKEVGRSIARAIRRFKAWLDSFFDGGKETPKEITPTDGPNWSWGSGAAKVVLYVLLGLVIVALLWVLWTAWRQARRVQQAVVAGVGSAPVTPDLRDESISAAQLPSDGWLELARQQMAAGNWRLALRALYLSTLARLADEGLVTLAKFKTNLDYERELARRALTRTEVVDGFRTRRRTFEDVWYGEVPAGEAQVRDWLGELERTAPAPAPATTGAAP